jgi:hypothetical protein
MATQKTQKRYFTTTKSGEEVEVDQNTAQELVRTGKKTPEDFQIEEQSIEQPKTLAEQAVGLAVRPEAEIRPRPSSISEGVMRVAKGTAESMLPPISYEGMKRLVSPMPGQYGMSRVGQEISAYGNEDISKLASEYASSPNKMNPALRATIATGGEIAGNMLMPSPSDMALGVGFGGAGKVGSKGMGGEIYTPFNKMGEVATEGYINTPTAIEKKLAEQAKPTLGKQILDKVPEILGFRTRKQAIPVVNDKLKSIESEVQSLLDADSALVSKAKQLPAKKPLELPYSPTKQKGTEPSIPAVEPQAEIPTQDISYPGRTSILPAPMGIPEPKVGTIASGYKEPVAEALQTAPKLFKKGGSKGVFRKEDEAIESTQNSYVKQSQKENVEFFKQDREAKKKIAEAEAERVKVLEEIKAENSKRLTEKQEAMSKREEDKIISDRLKKIGVVETKDIVPEFAKLRAEYGTGVNKRDMAKIENAMNSFLEETPKLLDKKTAMILKRRNDSLVGKAYNKLKDASETVKTEVNELIGNFLRNKLKELDPKLGELAEKESLLIKANQGLVEGSKSIKGGSIVWDSVKQILREGEQRGVGLVAPSLYKAGKTTKNIQKSAFMLPPVTKKINEQN